MNIDGYDRDFDDGDNADKADDTKKAKNVVIAAFVQPQAAENKQELDEYYKERN